MKQRGGGECVCMSGILTLNIILSSEGIYTAWINQVSL